MYKLTQHKLWRALALIMSIMLAVFNVACVDHDDDDDDAAATNDDDDDDDDDAAATNDDDGDDAGPPDATTVTVDPAPGATIPSNQQFTLTFDEGVQAATVNGTAATGSGLYWTASPALAQGSATLNVEWTNRSGSTGSQAVGPYTVSDPDVTPASINASGAWFDFLLRLSEEPVWLIQLRLALLVYAVYLIHRGYEWIYPSEKLRKLRDNQRESAQAPINAGGFRFDFDEAVTGTIDITDEAGASLNWTANVGGQTATFTAVARQELANETTYKVEIDVNDGAGNETKLTLTFVTKAKE